MKLLVTGASGFIGSHIVSYFKDRNHLVQTLGRNVEDTYRVDLSRDYLRVDDTFDLIIHCAGIVHKKEHAYTFSRKLYEIDQAITNNFLKSISKTSYTRLIMLSSIAVYGLNSGTNIEESQECRAKSSYGRGKIYSELKFLEFDRKKTLILRLPLVYGPNPKGNLALAIKSIRKGRMILFRPNNSKKSIINVFRLCEIIENDYHKLSGVYNLKSQDVIFNEFIKELSNHLGKGKIYFLPIMLLTPIKAFSKIISRNFFETLKKIDSDLTISDQKFQNYTNDK